MEKELLYLRKQHPMKRKLQQQHEQLQQVHRSQWETFSVQCVENYIPGWTVCRSISKSTILPLKVVFPAQKTIARKSLRPDMRCSSTVMGTRSTSPALTNVHCARLKPKGMEDLEGMKRCTAAINYCKIGRASRNRVIVEQMLYKCKY